MSLLVQHVLKRPTIGFPYKTFIPFSSVLLEILPEVCDRGIYNEAEQRWRGQQCDVSVLLEKAQYV